jgi:hypothetical protein
VPGRRAREIGSGKREKLRRRNEAIKGGLAKCQNDLITRGRPWISVIQLIEGIEKNVGES